MIEHLEKSTNTVKSGQRLFRRVLIGVYLIIWAMTVIAFWLGSCFDSNFSSYPFGVLNMVLYVCTLIISIFIGHDEDWGIYKWLMPCFFAAMHLLVSWLTYYLSMVIVHISDSRHGIILPYLDMDIILPGFACSMVGVFLGMVFKNFLKK